MIMRIRGPVLAALTVLAGCQATTATSTTNASSSELEFVTEAFNVIEFDRLECGLAVSQAKRPEVRSLAEAMLRQSEDFDGRLRPIAASAEIKPPTVLRTALRVRAARLRLSQGKDFDASFIDDQIVSHQDALNLQYVLADTPGSDRQLVELSAQGTELLKDFLTQLHALQGKQVRTKG